MKKGASARTVRAAKGGGAKRKKLRGEPVQKAAITSLGRRRRP